MIIHPGVGKSGTTTLQEGLFNRLENVHNIGRPNHRVDEYRSFRSALTLDSRNVGSIKVAAFVKRHMAEAGGKTVVLSDETLGGTGASLATVARRLSVAAPEAKILITTRSQLTAIPSYFSSHGRTLKELPNPYNGRQIAFGDWWSWVMQNQNGSFLDRLRYDDFVETWKEYFGTVVVLPMEWLSSDLNKTSQVLAELTQSEVQACFSLLSEQPAMNTRDKARAVRILRLKQRIFGGASVGRSIPGKKYWRAALERFSEGGKPYEPQITDHVVRQINALYSERNTRLEAMTGLNLKGLGYP